MAGSNVEDSLISTFAVLEPSRTVIVTALTGPLVTPPLSVQVGGVPVGVVSSGHFEDATDSIQ